MIFTIFSGVSLFDLLLIGSAIYFYFKNRKLAKLNKKFEDEISDLVINKEGQVSDKNEGGDDCAW